MEPTEAWPGIDSALLELGILCGDVTDRSFMKKATEKSHVPMNDQNLTGESGKCHDRYLLPCQAWNRPSILPQVGGIRGQNDNWGNNCLPSDGENSENTEIVQTTKLVKISDVKGNVVFGDTNPYSPYLSQVFRENEDPSVVKMNSQYMTAISISAAGSSSVVFQQSDLHPKAVKTHTIPKHGLSLPSVRHHMRPYEIPWRREERVRTSSETVEKDASLNLMEPIDISLIYDSYSRSNAEKFRRSLLKSRSLENVRLAEDEILHTSVHDMDSMSRRIQHLHVDE